MKTNVCRLTPLSSASHPMTAVAGAPRHTSAPGMVSVCRTSVSAQAHGSVRLATSPVLTTRATRVSRSTPSAMHCPPALARLICSGAAPMESRAPQTSRCVLLKSLVPLALSSALTILASQTQNTACSHPQVYPRSSVAVARQTSDAPTGNVQPAVRRRSRLTVQPLGKCNAPVPSSVQVLTKPALQVFTALSSPTILTSSRRLYVTLVLKYALGTIKGVRNQLVNPRSTTLA